MNKELMKLLKRQSEIVGKISKGDATEQDKRELDDLNKKIEELANPESVDVGKTELSTMTVAEFKKHVQSEQSDATAKLDTKRLALLKRNIEAVKAQNKKGDDEIVAVEVFAKAKKSDDRIDAMEAKINELFELVKGFKFDGRGATGVISNQPKPAATVDQEPAPAPAEGEAPAQTEGEAAEKTAATAAKVSDMPQTTATAIEVLGAIIGRYMKVKELIESGKSFTAEELQKLWPGWELRSAVETATAVLAKMDEFKGLSADVHEKLEKALVAKEGPKDDEDEDGDEDDDDGDEVSKGGTVSKWASGADISSPAGDAKKEFGICKKSSLIGL